MGRPSKFTEAIITEICARLAQGEPLAVICRTKGMPNRCTIYEWEVSHPDVYQRIARARAEGEDVIAEGCLEIADDARNDWMERQTAAGKVTLFNAEHVQRSKLRIETRLKLLAKWNPRKYGDKLGLHGVDGEPGIKIDILKKLAEGRARVAKLRGKPVA